MTFTNGKLQIHAELLSSINLCVLLFRWGLLDVRGFFIATYLDSACLHMVEVMVGIRTLSIT